MTDKLRKVMTMQYNNKRELVDYREAYFHCFGLQEADAGLSESIAIVEYIDDGVVDCFYPICIRFLDKPEV